MKLFSIRVIEIIWAYYLERKKGGQRVLLFLKAFSWETNLWVTLDDFPVKTQNWEAKSVFKGTSHDSIFQFSLFPTLDDIFAV